MLSHDFIRDEDIVRRYATGRLPADESERFEAHFLDCADCQQELESFDLLRTGLTEIAAEKVVRPRRFFSATRLALAAVLAGLLVLPVAMILRDTASVSGIAPIGNVPMLPVTQLRSVASDPQAVIRPEPGKPFVLMLELDWPEHAGYDVRIVDADGEARWQDSGLEPNYLDSLAVSIPAGYLEAGIYTAEVSAEAGERQIGAFAFEVLPSEASR